MTEVLPNEPLILEAKQAFPDVQAAFALSPPATFRGRYTISWVGTNVLATRGSFALVSIDDPTLEDLVGEHLRIHALTRSVSVYCTSRETLPAQICLTRRAFLAIAPLTVEPISCAIEVLDR